MSARGSYTDQYCRKRFGLGAFERLKGCRDGIPEAEKSAIIQELKKQLNNPIHNEKLCVETPYGKYKVRIAILHPDGLYTIRQHDIDTLKETSMYKMRSLLNPFLQKGSARNIDIVDVLCSPGKPGIDDTHLALTKFSQRSRKLSAMSLPNRMSNDQMKLILDKINMDDKNKQAIERILRTYSESGGTKQRVRYEDCTAEELRHRAARRGIALPANASKSTIITTLRSHN